LQFYNYLRHTQYSWDEKDERKEERRRRRRMRGRGGGGEANLLGDPLIAWMTVYGR